MAGCPRVTHPSATKSYPLPSEKFRGYAPFDLHVLSTPPAFILSQDQTLDMIYLPRNLPAGSCPLAASRSSDEFDSLDSGYKTSFSGFLFSVFFTSWFSFFLKFSEAPAPRSLLLLTGPPVRSRMLHGTSLLEFFRVALLFICQGACRI